MTTNYALRNSPSTPSSLSTSSLPKNLSASSLISLPTSLSSSSLSSLARSSLSLSGSTGWSSGYQPLCFHKEVFNSPSFSVDGFIADCRKRVPLESVRNDLRAYGTSLENELVELINKDYTDFVNLSSNLAGIDSVLSELRSPLKQISKDIEVCIVLVNSTNIYRYSVTLFKSALVLWSKRLRREKRYLTEKSIYCYSLTSPMRSTA